MSKWGKSKQARRKADRLFPGLQKPSAPPREVAVAVESVDDGEEPVVRPPHQSNPFGHGFEQQREWCENADERIFTVPRSIEIPPGYKSAADVREAMRRAWEVEWDNFERNTVDIFLPSDWTVTGSKEGRFQIIGTYGVRAVWDRSPDTKMQLLARYCVDGKFDRKDNHCQLIVRDRQDGSEVHSSYWYPQSGENHPQWAEMQNWLNQFFPEHDDPLLHWDDCDDNNERWVEP